MAAGRRFQRRPFHEMSIELRNVNYRQQKKAREDARKVRQAKRQERRQAPLAEPIAAVVPEATEKT